MGSVRETAIHVTSPLGVGDRDHDVKNGWIYSSLCIALGFASLGFAQTRQRGLRKQKSGGCLTAMEVSSKHGNVCQFKSPFAKLCNCKMKIYSAFRALVTKALEVCGNATIALFSVFFCFVPRNIPRELTYQSPGSEQLLTCCCCWLSGRIRISGGWTPRIRGYQSFVLFWQCGTVKRLACLPTCLPTF